MFKLDKCTANPFEFEFEGKTYTVPNKLDLPMPVFMAIRKAIIESNDPQEALFDEVMKLFEQYVPEVMEKITLSQATELFKAYAIDEGDSLGES